MLRLLIKSLARGFFQQHAGFFLVGFYVLFGIVEPSQLIGYHKALLIAGISSPIGLAFVFVSWFLYVLKVYFFMKQKLSLAPYKFLNEIAKLGKSRQLKLWLNFYGVILSPIIIYVYALIGLSIHHHFFLSLICIIIFFSALIFGLSFLSYQWLTLGFMKQEKPQINFNINLKRPFFSWPIIHLFKDQTLMLFMCKLSSLICFKAILWMFADVGDDIRVILVALLAAVLCHVFLIYTLLRFELTFLNFTKSLPISIYERLGRWFLTFAIILIPEWILITIISDYNLYAVANGFLFGLTGLLFLLTVLYFVKLNMDNYLKWLLIFFFISMWSILGHYYLLFALVLLGCCSLYYVIRFDKIDLQAE